MTTTPDITSPRLRGIVNELDGETREAFLRHLRGRSSAEWLAETLSGAGWPVSASTVRSQRRAWLAQEEGRK